MTGVQTCALPICTLRNPNTGISETGRHLSEINIDWLVTLWNSYVELSIERKAWKEHAVTILLQNSDVDEVLIREFVKDHWQNLLLDSDNIEAFKNWLQGEESVRRAVLLTKKTKANTRLND